MEEDERRAAKTGHGEKTMKSSAGLAGRRSMRLPWLVKVAREEEQTVEAEKNVFRPGEAETGEAEKVGVAATFKLQSSS